MGKLKDKENKVLIVKRNEEKQVELREKSQWIRDILIKMGIPGVEEWAEDLTMDDLRRIRGELKELDVDILDDTNNGIDIYWNNNLIAEWKRPAYVLRSNPNELDPKYKFYLEMHLNTRDAFDTAEQGGNNN